MSFSGGWLQQVQGEVGLASGAVVGIDPLANTIQGQVGIDPLANTVTTATDPAQLDAFSRLRVGLPKLRLSAIFDIDKRPEFWDESITGTGTCVHLPAQRCVDMSLDGVGDTLIRQTREYFVYRAGQSQLVFCTFAMGTTNANEFLEVGYFDDDDGIFFRSNAGLSFVLRSSTAGFPVDTVVAQASWNLDRLDGTGPSGITLDVTKTQILVIDFQWLGVGRVRVGFDIDGVIMYAHEFMNANTTQTTVYMKTPKLPVRYQARSTDVPSVPPAFLRQICSTVIREGGEDEPNVELEARSNANVTVGTSWETVLGLRLGTNNRATLRLLETQVFVASAGTVEYQIVLNPAYTGTPTWKVAGQYSVADFSRSNLAVTVDGDGDVTQGIVLPLGGFADGGNGKASVSPSTNLVGTVIPIAANIAGTSDEAWLMARAISGTEDIRALFDWNEER